MIKLNYQNSVFCCIGFTVNLTNISTNTVLFYFSNEPQYLFIWFMFCRCFSYHTPGRTPGIQPGLNLSDDCLGAAPRDSRNWPRSCSEWRCRRGSTARWVTHVLTIRMDIPRDAHWKSPLSRVRIAQVVRHWISVVLTLESTIDSVLFFYYLKLSSGFPLVFQTR